MVAQGRIRASARVDDLLVLGAQLADRGAVLLFNPNHDSHTGEFASGGGSGSTTGAAKGGRGRSGSGKGGKGSRNGAAVSNGEAKASAGSSGSERETAAERQRAHEAEAAAHEAAAKAALKKRDAAYAAGRNEASNRYHAEAQREFAAQRESMNAAQREATIARSQDAHGNQLPEARPGAAHPEMLVNPHTPEEDAYLRSEFPKLYVDNNGVQRGNMQLGIRTTDARLVAHLYGEHQTGAVLHRESLKDLRDSATLHGLDTKGSKAALVSRLTSFATGGRYSASFKPSTAEVHAAKAARLQARVSSLESQLSAARSAYATHMANAPKLSEPSEQSAHAREAARLQAEVERLTVALGEERAGMQTTATRLPDALQRVLRFDETGPDGFHRSWIMLFPVGHYQHEQYGELDFTPEKLRKIKAQYDQRVRHIDAALDVDHRAARDDSRATGWIESLELRDTQPDGTPAGLWGCIKWTPYGMQFLRADEYRYFSPEFGPWEDPQTGEKFEDVLIGGALTNRPFLKTMPAIALAEARGQAISRKPWGNVNKSLLPRSCFLIVGDPAKKSTWRLPVYEGAGNLVGGVFERRGPLNINGVKAAWDALGGAHTGEPMAGVPAEVRARLARWRARYFPSAKADAKADAKRASERTFEWWRLPVGEATGSGRVMEGRVGRKYASDLDEGEFEDEDTDGARALADKPAKGSAAMKARMAALRKKSSLKLGKKDGKKAEDDEEGDDDADELAEPEEDDAAAMAEDGAEDEVYDEADGDGPDTELAEDNEEDDADDDVDPEDDDGPEDEDESDDEPPARRGRGKSGGKSKTAKQMMGARTAVRGGAHVRASERGSMEREGEGSENISLAEAQRLREEVAQLRFKLYEEGIEKTLAGWRKGSFQFKESAKGAAKTGRIALSRGFSEAFRAFMRSEGVRLSETTRGKLLGLIEIALSSAVVDLSERGSSYDGEGRMVAPARGRAAGDDDRLQQAAERIALAEHGKPIAALTEDPAKLLAIYERASREVRY